jgi:hypothetical protein
MVFTVAIEIPEIIFKLQQFLLKNRLLLKLNKNVLGEILNQVLDRSTCQPSWKRLWQFGHIRQMSAFRVDSPTLNET